MDKISAIAGEFVAQVHTLWMYNKMATITFGAVCFFVGAFIF